MFIFQMIYERPKLRLNLHRCRVTIDRQNETSHPVTGHGREPTLSGDRFRPGAAVQPFRIAAVRGPHSITMSARARIELGILMPSAFAVLRLIAR